MKCDEIESRDSYDCHNLFRNKETKNSIKSLQTIHRYCSFVDREYFQHISCASVVQALGHSCFRTLQTRAI